VERSDEVIIRNAFQRVSFSSLADANNLLIDVLKEINSKCPFGKDKTAYELLEEEQINLLPNMPFLFLLLYNIKIILE